MVADFQWASEKMRSQLISHAPREAPAGETNSIRTTVAGGCSYHNGAWAPDGQAIAYFADPVGWSANR